MYEDCVKEMGPICRGEKERRKEEELHCEMRGKAELSWNLFTSGRVTLLKVIVHFKQFCTKYFSSEQQLKRLYCDVVVGSFCPLESTISRKTKESATNQHLVGQAGRNRFSDAVMYLYLQRSETCTELFSLWGFMIVLKVGCRRNRL